MNYTTDYQMTDEGICVETETGRVCGHVIVKVVSATSKTGTPFTAFKLVTANKKFIDLRFSRACADAGEVPAGLTPGYYIFIIDEKDIRIDRNRVYPCAYASHCAGVLPFNGKFDTDFEAKA